MKVTNIRKSEKDMPANPVPYAIIYKSNLIVLITEKRGGFVLDAGELSHIYKVGDYSTN